MKVEYQHDNRKAGEAEFFVMGQCIGLEVDAVTHRVALTPNQWLLLADAAAERAGLLPVARADGPGLLRFVNVAARVMRGTDWVASACSTTMAKRIARALNNHKTNREGV